MKSLSKVIERELIKREAKAKADKINKELAKERIFLLKTELEKQKKGKYKDVKIVINGAFMDVLSPVSSNLDFSVMTIGSDDLWVRWGYKSFYCENDEEAFELITKKWIELV